MNSDADIQDAMRDGDVITSGRHDNAVLSAARGAAADIAARSAASNDRNSAPGWNRWPLALAASFALGIATTVAIQELRGPSIDTGVASSVLTIPVITVTRDNGDAAPERMLPVSEAEPQLWLEHIQELVYNGELAEAEQHIRAFRQLHPDYRYTP